VAQGLLGIETLAREEIQAILDRARDFQPRPAQSFRSTICCATGWW
jgi:hypothetical protein